MAHTTESGRSVAVTGACGYLGARLIQALEEDWRYEKVLALDIRRPPVPVAKTQFHRVDLTSPNAGATVASILRREAVDTFVHLAFLYEPTHQIEWAHELESAGTMHVLNACAEVGVRQFVLWSQTVCYGARPENPSLLTEEAPLVDSRDAPSFVADKVDAESQVRQFARERPEVAVAVLRMAPLVARGTASWVARYLSRPAVPVLMGHDPLVQLLHGQDAVDFLRLVLERRAAGVYNVVGRGVLPLRTALAVLGRVSVPVPESLGRPLLGLAWAVQFVQFPPEMLDYLRYPCVADGTKAARDLGWRARYHILDTLAELGGEVGRPPRGRGK